MSGEIIKRNSTLIHQYVKGVLGKNGLSKKQKEEHYKNNNLDLHICAYCGENANTLDHIFGIVNDKKFSGYTNDISNLIPACSRCNSSKGNNDWDKWLKKPENKSSYVKEITSKTGFVERKTIIKKYIKNNKTMDKKIKPELLEILNKNITIFNEEMNKKLRELDELYYQHEQFYQKNK